MGPGFGNMTLSNRHKMTLSVNGKLGSFSFQGVWHRHKHPVGITMIENVSDLLLAAHICVLVVTAAFKGKKTGF